MYQAGLEYVLGVKRIQQRLYINPCVPEDWKTFSVTYKYGDAVYHVDVHCELDANANDGVSDNDLPMWIVDGREVLQSYLELEDDRQEHHVTLYMSPQMFKTVG